MSVNILDDRRKALEEEFFSRKDREAIEQMRAANAARTRREALAEASHISDDAVLTSLDAAGISPETLTAISLIPLVVVAWADGSVKDAERAAIEKAANDAGLNEAGVGLLDGWLTDRPSAQLLDSWKAYLGALKGTLPAGEYTALRDQILNNARDVAAAAGGFLGIGAISAAETRVLESLSNAFNG
ncbi:MAG: hypothetical protein AAFV53_18315 [Myxococcota bacterium]